MDEEILLIAVAAGIGIWALSKFSSPISKTLDSVGSVASDTAGMYSAFAHDVIDFLNAGNNRGNGSNAVNTTPPPASPGAPVVRVEAGQILSGFKQPLGVFGEYNLGGIAVTGNVLNQIAAMQQTGGEANIFNAPGVQTDTRFMSSSQPQQPRLTTATVSVAPKINSMPSSSRAPSLQVTKTPVNSSGDLRNASYQAMAAKFKK